MRVETVFVLHFVLRNKKNCVGEPTQFLTYCSGSVHACWVGGRNFVPGMRVFSFFYSIFTYPPKQRQVGVILLFRGFQNKLRLGIGRKHGSEHVIVPDTPQLLSN
jgi:hypothetical protein